MPLFAPGLDPTGGTITGNLSINGDLNVDGASLVMGVASFHSGISTITPGTGLSIKEGSDIVDGMMGVVTLNGITEVTIPNTTVADNSRIFLSVQEPSGILGGMAYISSRIAGTSFGVKGLVVGDTSTVAWLIINPN